MNPDPISYIAGGCTCLFMIGLFNLLYFLLAVWRAPYDPNDERKPQ